MLPYSGTPTQQQARSRVQSAAPVSALPSSASSRAADAFLDLMPDVVLLQQQDLSSLETRTVRMAASMAERPIAILNAAAGQLSDHHAVLRGRRCLPVGSVEFIRQAMQVTGIQEPAWECYPKELLSYLSTRPERTTIERVLAMGRPVFVKPQAIKAFDGFVYQPRGFDREACLKRWQIWGDPDPYAAALEEEARYRQLLDTVMALPGSTPVWMADPREFLSEYRYYLMDGRIIGHARYDAGPEDAPAPSDVDITSILADTAPNLTCSLDLGVTVDGGTWLIEANDAWALGYYMGEYAPSPAAYLSMLWTRWQQLLATATPAGQ